MNLFHAKETLPQGYRLILRIDLLRNRGQLRMVLLLSLAWVVLGILLGIALGPSIGSLFMDGWWVTLGRVAALSVGIAVYIAGHEAVHGALMWLVSRKKPRFGFKLMYAYAGSPLFFSKWAYLCIALSPVILWGAGLLWLALSLPAGWFWVVWGIEITNLSGAAGDLYVFCRILPKPNHVLIQDSGTIMNVYGRP